MTAHGNVTEVFTVILGNATSNALVFTNGTDATTSTWFPMTTVADSGSVTGNGTGRDDDGGGGGNGANADMKYHCDLMNFVVRVGIMVPMILFGFVGNTLSEMVMWPERNKSATSFSLLMLAVVSHFSAFLAFHQEPAVGLDYRLEYRPLVQSEPFACTSLLLKTFLTQQKSLLKCFWYHR